MPTTPPRPLPSPLAGILFDLDGTLVDTEGMHYDSAMAVLARYGKTLSKEAFKPYIGTAEVPFWEDLQRMLELPAAIDELLTARTEEYLKLLHTASIEPLSGVLDLVHWALDRQLPIAVASSSPRDQIHGSLTAAGLAELIPVRRSGHEDVGVGRGKPHGDVYLAAAKALGIDARQCLAVEDSTTGMRSAKDAGCYVFCVPNASFPPKDVSFADQVVDSMADVHAAARKLVD
ncbi:MAG: HAD family phosphatase [Planctomycetes bacterium]|nr:HAD family phosphatase [Planctomycetota bacterium]MCP4861090.1 HAD family phosphatase [Planctomycetota bacterium]